MLHSTDVKPIIVVYKNIVALELIMQLIAVKSFVCFVRS